MRYTDRSGDRSESRQTSAANDLKIKIPCPGNAKTCRNSTRARTGAHGGQAFFAHSTNYLIEVKNAIIVDVEATTVIRQAEVLAAKHMIGRSMERFNLYPARIMGDSAYGSADMLGWLVYDQGIEPHVTVFDSPRAKTAPSHGTTSPTTMSATSSLAPPARR